MLPFDPFAWFYSLIGYMQEFWQKLAIVDRVRNSFVVSRLFGAFDRVPGISSLKNSALAQKAQESGLLDRLAQFGTAVLSFGVVQPFQWFIGLLGLSFEWLISRTWIGILLNGIPAFALLATALLAWWGSVMDRSKMADYYFELAKAATADLRGNEIPIEENKSDSKEKNDPVADDLEPGDLQQRFDFAKSLYYRSYLFQPNNDRKIFIAATMADGGMYEGAYKIMRGLAPSDRKGVHALSAVAHNVVATSLLNEYNRSGNEELLPRFQHHAEHSLAFRKTPKEVLLLLSELQKKQGDAAGAVRTLRIAAERYEGLSDLLVETAVELKDPQLAAFARQQTRQRLEAVLAQDPENYQVRIRLAQMMDTNLTTLPQIEQLLREGIEIEPHAALTRALSEVYRIMFVRQLVKSQQTFVDLNVLDAALQTDPTNPLVADQIQSLVRSRLRPLEALSNDLNKILASGAATIATHALLAEIHLDQQRNDQALLHLQQVFLAAPAAAKYTDHLVQLYLAQGKMDEAISTGVQAVRFIERDKLQREKYVDGLLHTMGTVYLKAGREEDAEKFFKDALAANPNRLDTREELAAHYRRIGKEEDAMVHEQFVSSHKTSSESQPSNPTEEDASLQSE